MRHAVVTVRAPYSRAREFNRKSKGTGVEQARDRRQRIAQLARDRGQSQASLRLSKPQARHGARNREFNRRSRECFPSMAEYQGNKDAGETSPRRPSICCAPWTWTTMHYVGGTSIRQSECMSSSQELDLRQARPRYGILFDTSASTTVNRRPSNGFSERSFRARNRSSSRLRHLSNVSPRP